ncbi:MAG: response regulator transcription factor [Sphingomonadales bacterium]|nr:response regulator transcription factor [Sphingomonadales bacterium]
MQTSPIRVLIADEYDIYRAGFKAALKKAQDIQVIGEAGTTPALFALLETTQPDVIFLDLALPRSKGIKTLLQVSRAAPAAKILLLGYSMETSLLETLSKAGANGYLSKTAEIKEVANAARSVISQGYYVSDSDNQPEIESVFRPFTITPLRTRCPLTDKEVTVLRIFFQEQTTRDIASSLSLSPRTVESIRDKIKFKTGSRNLAGMAFFALKNGLIRLQ